MLSLGLTFFYSLWFDYTEQRNSKGQFKKTHLKKKGGAQNPVCNGIAISYVRNKKQEHTQDFYLHILILWGAFSILLVVFSPSH